MNGSLIAAFVGCNRVVGCLDWSVNNLIAFGASNFVAIYDIENGRVVGILNGHSQQINCVKWINSAIEELDRCLVTGSADKSIRLWKWKDGVGELIATSTDFDSGVNSLALIVQNSSIIIAASCASPTISVLQTSSRVLSKKGEIKMGDVIQLSLAMSELPASHGQILLASGGADCNIRLFIQSQSFTFSPVCILRGHENWIRHLDFHSIENDSKLLLASASQDRFARVWSITLTQSQTERRPLSLLAQQLSFNVSESEYSVKLDGLLTGHEDWIHTVQFSPRSSTEIELLTASMDRTMIIWRWDASQNWWIQKSSVGDAGSSSLGYYGGFYSPDATAILSHGYTGSLHLWKQDQEGNWMPHNTLTGHSAEVQDIKFISYKETNSSCLFNASKDQTVRIFASVKANWCEIGRPQVHGHDFYQLTLIPGTLPWSFASCSEEKVIRVFEAPLTFHQYLHENGLSTDPLSIDRSVPFGATIKALALTNTAVFEEQESEATKAEGEYTTGPDFAPRADPHVVRGAPLEEHLSQNTLWPETQKLYGHGDVVFCLDCSPCGQFLASACKAQRADVAMIFIWDTESWTVKQQLTGHTLTVTRLQFSPSGRYLLSGSRDRTFCVFINREGEFVLLEHKKKAHGRIIWDTAWTPDEAFFATGSRDQSIKLWNMPECELVKTVSFQSPVTALSFHSHSTESSLLAVGLDDGQLEVWKVMKSVSSDQGLDCEIQWRADVHSRHSGTVHRVCWSTSDAIGLTEVSSLILATCSADHSIRLFQFPNE